MTHGLDKIRRAMELLNRLIYAAPRSPYLVTVAVKQGRVTEMAQVNARTTDAGVYIEEEDLTMIGALCLLSAETSEGGLIALDDATHVRAWELRRGNAIPLTAAQVRKLSESAVLLAHQSEPIDAFQLPPEA